MHLWQGQVRPEAYAAYWRNHWTALSTAEVNAASGRICYGSEETEALCQDAIKALDLRLTDLLLDIGCAKGLMKDHLVRHVAAYIGLDYIAAFNPGIVGDALELPFRNCSFDKVLLSGVLVCIPPEWHHRTLAEIHRVTRFGGRAFVSHNPCQRIHDMACVFDRQELMQLARRCGWASTKIVPINPILEQASCYFDMVLYRD